MDVVVSTRGDHRVGEAVTLRVAAHRIYDIAAAG